MFVSVETIKVTNPQRFGEILARSGQRRGRRALVIPHTMRISTPIPTAADQRTAVGRSSLSRVSAATTASRIAVAAWMRRSGRGSG
jgi:hypothetical protein